VTEPGGCQPTAMERLAIGRVVAAHTSMGTALAFKRWQSGIALRDIEQPHWHLGPMGVEPGDQGGGIGTTLMAEFGRMMDFGRQPAFLGTDRKENLDFFAAHGFREYCSAAIEGMSHWFMIRPRN